MPTQNSTQRNGLSLASFTPITYTPKLMDMNMYNTVLSGMEEKHYKALQGQAEIAKTLRELNLNPKEDGYISNLAAQYQQKIGNAVSSDTGYAGNALDAVFEVGKDIQENQVLWGKVRNSKIYDDAKAKVTKLYEDGKIDDKAYNRWLEQNPYTSVIKKEGETDETAIQNRKAEADYEEALDLETKGILRPILNNPPSSLNKKEIGVVNWSQTYNPVEKVSMSEIFTEAMKYVSDEKGKFEKVYFMDRNGNFTEDFSNSVDGYWYSKVGGKYDKLSDEKIANAINTAIEGNSKFRQSLEQEYEDEAWDYNKHKDTYNNASGLINDKGVKKNFTNYVSDKIAKIANLKSYNYYEATKDFNNEASKMLALRRGASGNGVDINPDVDSFMGTTGISILHDTNETVDQVLSKRDIDYSRLNKYFKASGLDDDSINKLLSNDYITIDDKQYDAAEYIVKLFNDGEIDYRTGYDLLRANTNKLVRDKWYADLVARATPEQKKAFDFFEDLSTGNILNTDNEISKMFEQFDIDENSYITVDNYTNVDGAKKKYNITELAELITLVGNSDGNIALTLHDNQGDTSLATGVYQELGSAYLPEVSYTTRIKDIYNNYRKKKDEIVKNKIGEKIHSISLLGETSFTRMGIEKQRQEGIIDHQRYSELSQNAENTIKSHLASNGWANMNVYFSEDGDTDGNYLRKLVDSKERVEKGEMYKKAILSGKVHMQATVNPVTGRPAIYVSVSPYNEHKGGDSKYAKGFTMLIDDLEISAEAEKYVNDTDTQALIQYTENNSIGCDYAVSGTGITAIDGDSFDCLGDIPSRDKLKVISGCKILEELYTAVRLGLDLNNEQNVKRIDAAVKEALSNISGYYQFDDTDLLTAREQVYNTIKKMKQNERK